MKEVILRIWYAKNDSWIPSRAGHVSLETDKIYASFYPETLLKQLSPFGVKSIFTSSYEDDVKKLGRPHDKEIKIRNLNTNNINSTFNEFKRKGENNIRWSIFASILKIDDMNIFNCVTFVYMLLKIGGMDRIFDEKKIQFSLIDPQFNPKKMTQATQILYFFNKSRPYIAFIRDMYFFNGHNQKNHKLECDLMMEISILIGLFESFSQKNKLPPGNHSDSFEALSALMYAHARGITACTINLWFLHIPFKYLEINVNQEGYADDFKFYIFLFFFAFFIEKLMNFIFNVGEIIRQHSNPIVVKSIEKMGKILSELELIQQEEGIGFEENIFSPNKEEIDNGIEIRAAPAPSTLVHKRSSAFSKVFN